MDSHNVNIVITPQLVEDSLLFYRNYLNSNISSSNPDQALNIKNLLLEVNDTYEGYKYDDKVFELINEKLKSSDSLIDDKINLINIDNLDAIVSEHKCYKLNIAIDDYIQSLESVIQDDTDFPEDRLHYDQQIEKLKLLKQDYSGDYKNYYASLNYGVPENKLLIAHLNNNSTAISLSYDKSLNNYNAKEEALNSSTHLKTNNKMETKNEQQTEKKETITVAGNVGSISELKGNDKKYVDISIAVNKPGDAAEFKNVRVWEDSKHVDDYKNLKVGDYIKVEGYSKTLPKIEGKNEVTVFNVTSVAEVKPKDGLKISGNLGGEPEFKDVNGKQVATLSIAINDNGTATWKRIQLWEEKAEAVRNLKTGDFVTVEGKEGKEYSYKNKAGDTVLAKDIIATSVIKHERKNKEELNAELIGHAQKGDWEKVSDTLKKGADSKAVTEEHLKDLSPKQQDAIKNTIRAHEDFVAKKDEKKNSGLKM